MKSYLNTEMSRNDEDLLREINGLMLNLKAAGSAIHAGEGTMKTDTDWLCSSAAKVERMIEKRNLLGTLLVVEANTERSVTAAVAARMEEARALVPVDAARRTDAIDKLVDEGWTVQAAYNHVEGTCDIAVCTHEAHRSDPDRPRRSGNRWV